MKYLSMILLPIVILIVSCSASGKIDCQGELVYNPDSFTAEEQVWIQESAVRWNIWVGHKVMSASQGTRDSCFIRIGDLIPSHIGEEYHRLGRISLDTDKMKTRGVYDRDGFEGILMHEMGHSLGFSHIGANGTALMSPSNANDFTSIDRGECVNLGICSQ